MTEKEKPKRIILDTSVLLGQPEVLGLFSPEAKYFVTESALREVLNYPASGSSSSLATIIQKAANEGNIVLAPRSAGSLVWPLPPNISASGSLSGSNIELLSYAVTSQKDAPNDEVLIATDDKTLAKFAVKAGIKVITGPALSAMMQRIGARVTSIADQIKSLVQKQWRSIIGSIVWSVITLLIAYVVYRNLEWILQNAYSWATWIGLFLIAVLFFWFRGKARLYYGFVELGVGFLVSTNVFGSSIDYSSFSTSMIIPLLGGIYIMVRGLDNIGKGLYGKKLQAKWNQWFPDYSRIP